MGNRGRLVCIWLGTSLALLGIYAGLPAIKAEGRGKGMKEAAIADGNPPVLQAPLLLCGHRAAGREGSRKGQAVRPGQRQPWDGAGKYGQTAGNGGTQSHRG